MRWISWIISSGLSGGGIDARALEPEVEDHRLEVGVGREGAEVAQGAELHPDVVGRGAQHEAQEGAPLDVVHATGDAEVEQGDLAVGHHEEVPAVQVAVEDALDEGALHEADHPGAHDGVGVDAGVAHGVDVVELEAVEALHHQHPPGDEGRVGAGDDVAALAQVDEAAGHVEHVLGLEAEVELLGDGLGEQLDQRRRVGQGGERQAPDEERGQPRHDLEVLGDEVGDGGALHLHHDPFAGAERGAVDLGDRRGGEGTAVEGGEDLVERSAQLALDGGAHVAERLGRNLVTAPS